MTTPRVSDADPASRRAHPASQPTTVVQKLPAPSCPYSALALFAPAIAPWMEMGLPTEAPVTLPYQPLLKMRSRMAPPSEWATRWKLVRRYRFGLQPVALVPLTRSFRQ